MPLDPGLRENAPDVELDLSVIQHSALYNADLAPVPTSGRKWGMLSFAALWVSMSACIPTYMLASSLIGGGGRATEGVGPASREDEGKAMRADVAARSAVSFMVRACFREVDSGRDGGCTALFRQSRGGL